MKKYRSNAIKRKTSSRPKYCRTAAGIEKEKNGLSKNRTQKHKNTSEE